MRHTPIVALTANAIKGEKERFLNAGMDCYLTKNHNYSVVTMGPLLTENELIELDNIIAKKRHNGFTRIMTLKKYYDNATINEIDKDSLEYKNILESDNNLNEVDINDKYYRLWVDKLVNLNF